jgi:hypothetical protein
MKPPRDFGDNRPAAAGGAPRGKVMRGIDVIAPARSPVWRRLRLSCLVMLLAVSLPGIGTAAAVRDVLRAAKRDAPVHLVAQDEESLAIDLDLREIAPFSRDAQIVVVSSDGTRRSIADATRYFEVQGRVDPSLRGIVMLRSDGRVRGLLRRADQFAWLQPDAKDVLRITALPQAKQDDTPFQCGNDDVAAAALQRAIATAPTTPLPAALEGDPPDGFRARIALETDNEFLALFGGDVEDATAYVGGLMAFISTIYRAEADTRMEVSFLRLWETPDPFDQTTTACALLQTGKYWNDNETAITRSTVHFLSGRQTLRAGIAWIGVLCNSPFNITPSQVTSSVCPGIDSGTASNYGGAYGVTMGVTGTFNAANPAIGWDVMAVAHEIGHNFSSPHTHCYAGIGDNPEPVDTCYSGESSCFSGSAALPGPQGQGSGTLMSYCHLRPGGLANTSLTFGSGHPFGVQPERVPARMLDHVRSRAASNAACLIEPIAQAELSASATPDTLMVGDSATLAASGGSGSGAVSFAVSAGGENCSVDGSTLTALAAGSCEITATKAGDNYYLPASANVAITVLGVQAPLVISTTPSTLVYGDVAQVEVTGGSGTGASTLELSAGNSICTLDGDTLTAIGIGDCELTASKEGDEDFAATSSVLPLTIGRAEQLPLTLDAAPAGIAQGGTSALAVSGGSGDGGVSLALTAGGALCTLNGTVLTAALTGTGTCTITATRSGGSLHLPATATIDVGVFVPAVDLGVTIARIVPAPPLSNSTGARSYRVSVINNGPVDAPDVRLQVDSSAGLLDLLWTCNAPQPCEPILGAAIADTRFDLPIGTTATLELDGEIDPTKNYIVIDAQAAPRTGMTALVPANDARRLVDGIGDRLFGNGFE